MLAAEMEALRLPLGVVISLPEARRKFASRWQPRRKLGLRCCVCTH